MILVAVRAGKILGALPEFKVNSPKHSAQFCRGLVGWRRSSVILQPIVQTQSNLIVASIRHSSAGRVKGSYLHGGVNTYTILHGKTVGQYVDEATARYADREAVVDCHQGIRKTFTQYREDIDKLATGLLAMDLRKGDRVAIWSQNCYEWALAQFATAKAGLIMVTINPAYKHSEFAYCLEKLGIRAVIAAEAFRTQDYHPLVAKVVPEVLQAKPGEKFKSKKYANFDILIMISKTDLPGAFKFSDVMEAGGQAEKVRLQELHNEIQFDDAVNIQFTSGTTGKPKAAVLTHHSTMNDAVLIATNNGYFLETARICSNVPLFHCFGCVGVTAAGLISGACAVFPAPGFSPTASLKAIKDEKCTTIYGTPTMFIDILNHPKFNELDVSHIRGGDFLSFTFVTNGIMAGAPCSPELIKRVHDQLNCKGLTIGYGSTELSPIVTMHHFKNDPLEKKMHTVGRIGDHLELKVVDSTDTLVPMGALGEICARGYVVMKGYWEDDEKTKDAIKDGWYHTGDLGTLSEDGYCTVLGRIKDMVIRGGENIYPSEIEDHLIKHPKIFDAHVIGVPDQRLGEEVCAWIKLKDNTAMTKDEIRDHCKEELAYFKVPRYVLFVDDFPKTGSGKIQKFVMREEMMRRLLSSSAADTSNSSAGILNQ